MTFSIQLRDVVILENQQLELVCQLSKEGPPVQWLKDSRKVTQTDRLSIVSEKDLQKLIITSATQDDSGVYVCKTATSETKAVVNIQGESDELS